MDQNATRRGATLARGADRTEHHGRHREIQVRRLIDDDCIVATELEQTLAETGGYALAHFASDRGRAGEGDECDPPVLDEPGRELGARIDEHLEYSRKLMRRHDAVADVLHGD